MKKVPRAFTLIEMVVAAALATVAVGAAVLLVHRSLRAGERAERFNETLEGAMVVMARLDRDLRRIRVVPGRPVVGWALQPSADARSVTLRLPSEGGSIHEPDLLVQYQVEQRPAPSTSLLLVRRLLSPGGDELSRHAYHRVGIRTIRFDLDPSVSPDMLLVRVRLLVRPVRERDDDPSWPVERVFRVPCAYGLEGRLPYAVLPAPTGGAS